MKNKILLCFHVTYQVILCPKNIWTVYESSRNMHILFFKFCGFLKICIWHLKKHEQKEMYKGEKRYYLGYDMKLSRPDTVCPTRFGSHTGAWHCSSAVWYEAMKRILAPIYFLPIPFFFLCPSRKEQAAQSNFIVCLPWAEMEETKRRHVAQ